MSGQKNNFFLQQSSGKSEGFLSKSLPASVDAERALLSAILLNESHLTEIIDVLHPDDFYVKQHQIIFRSLSTLSTDQKKIDLVVLHDYLVKEGLEQQSGGLQYLLELQEDIPALGLLQQHAQIIKEKALLRNLINTSSDIIGSCYEQRGATVDTILDNAEKKIFGLSNAVISQSFTPINSILKDTFKRLADANNQSHSITGVPSGFKKFDSMTSGMQRGDLLILAARPSMGKTALALNIAANAWHAGHAVGIFSLEMSSEQLVLRLLSSESRIPHQKIRTAAINSDEWMELTNTAARLSEAKIFIDDSASISIMELRAKARRLKSQSNISLLVIDYLQLINSGQRNENRTQEISMISRALKALAKELDIPVLALSQLSRSLESRVDKRPGLSDLRESGAIEQDGDVIFFVYRDVVYNKDTEYPDGTEIIIGKQRNGPIGTIFTRFTGEITRFEDAPERENSF
ncbi:replicative DNA helicase [Candidatus Dependentiae bacterium]|nr:MAG: replicative DNA helicase [Candidatus Dependentiae bacterium]